MKSETVQFVPAIDEAVAGKESQTMKFLAGLKNVRVWCGLLLSLCVLAPLMMMVTISLNPDEEQIMISMGTIKAFIPHVLSLENYREIWGDPNQPFARYLFNTLLIVFTTVFMSIVVNSSAAFALAWGQGGYRKIVIGVVVALLAIPGESLALPDKGEPRSG